jgi:hypothetical protein
VTTWLIDKSAMVRLAASPDAAKWATRIEQGLVRITTVPYSPSSQTRKVGLYHA